MPIYWWAYHVLKTAVSILVPHSIYLKECNHTKQSEHLTESTKFNFMATKIFCYMYHSLFYSHKSELSPTLHLIFKQHFRENSRGELQLCNHKWAPWRAGGIDKILVGEDGTRFFFHSTLKPVSCSSQNLTFKILVWPHKQMHVKVQEKRDCFQWYVHTGIIVAKLNILKIHSVLKRCKCTMAIWRTVACTN